MVEKTQQTEQDRLEKIEHRLLNLEEFFLHFAFVSVPPSVGWVRQASLPMPSLPAGVVFPALLKEKRREMRETPVAPWNYLVRRLHPWRKQLYVKGRNLTARQLVGSLQANKLEESAAATNYDLPVEAIREALAYVEKNKELLETEAEIERLMLKRGGIARGPQPVSG